MHLEVARLISMVNDGFTQLHKRTAKSDKSIKQIEDLSKETLKNWATARQAIGRLSDGAGTVRALDSQPNTGSLDSQGLIDLKDSNERLSTEVA